MSLEHEARSEKKRKSFLKHFCAFQKYARFMKNIHLMKAAHFIIQCSS